MISLWSTVPGTLTLLAAKLVVLPRVMRGLWLILLVSLPGIFALAFWVLPVHRQGETFATQAAQLTAQLASQSTLALDDQTGSGAAAYAVDDPPSPSATRRHLVWYSDQIWLQELVNLANHYGVSTQELKHTGLTRKEGREIASAVDAAQINYNVIGYLGQRGYEWHMTGTQANVGRLLASLARRTFWIDALDIWPTAAGSAQRQMGTPYVNATEAKASANNSNTGAHDTLVNATLTFRQSMWISKEAKPLPENHGSTLSMEQPHGTPVQLPSLAALFSSLDPTCVDSSVRAAPLTESHRVFADQALEQIRLVGVIEKTGEGGVRVRRGVFRGSSGALAVAAHNAEISSSGLRLVNLSKNRGVLYSEKQGSTVMKLEPEMMSRTRLHRQSVSGHPDYE